MLAALAALVLAVAALIKTLGGAFETRFSDLRKELAQVRAENVTIRAELEEERRLRVVAEQRAENAERHVNQLVDANVELRREVELVRSALIGNEAERNEALKELVRASIDRDREQSRGSVDDTGKHPAVK